jgi:hypothetical protein
MYLIVHSLTPRELVTAQIPALAIALVTAEVFFKFHSFALECLAFLATWYLLDAGLSRLRRLLDPERG